MANEKETINVYSTQKTIEVLGVCRIYFYNKYKYKLTKLPKQGKKNFFLESEVLVLKAEIDKNKNKMKSLGFNIVE